MDLIERLRSNSQPLMGVLPLCNEAADEIETLRAFKEASEGQEPVAWLFQHEETGRTQCVETYQVECGFERNNPRWQKISPLYLHPDHEAVKLRLQVATLTEQRDVALDALRSVVFGSGDWFNLMPATLHDSLCDYLAAIKSSEVKK